MVLPIFKYIRVFDIFGSYVGLNFKDSSVFRTNFGAVISVVFVGLILLFFWSNLTLFLQKQLVTVNDQKIFNSDPELLVLNETNFMIAIKLGVPDFMTNPYFMIQLQSVKYSIDDNGKTKTEKFQKYLEPCTIEHWESIPSHGFSWEKSIKKFNLTNSLCLSLNQSFSLQGSYGSENYQYLNLKISKCNQTLLDQNPNWKAQCKSDDEYQQYIEESAVTQIEMFIPNYIVNPGDPDTYLSSYLNSDLYFNVQPGLLYKNVDLFLSEVHIQTDQSISPFQKVKQENYPYFDINEFREQTVIGFSKVFFSMNINRSYFTRTTERKYQKIDEFISYVGGFVQAFLILCACIVGFYNEYVYLVELANMLYDFDLEEFDTEEQKRRKFSQSSRKRKNGIIQSTQILKALSERNIDVKDLNDDNQIIQIYSQKQKKNSQVEDKIENFKSNILSPQKIKSNNLNIQKFSNDIYNLEKQNDIHEERNDFKKNVQLETIKELVQRRKNTIKFVQRKKPNKIPQMIKYTLEDSDESQQKAQLENIQSDFNNDRLFTNDFILSSPPLNLEAEETQQQKQLNRLFKKISFKEPAYQHKASEETQMTPNLYSTPIIKKKLYGKLKSEKNLDDLKKNEIQSTTSTQNSQFLTQRRDFLTQEFKYIIQRNRKLFLGFEYFVNLLSCGKFCKTRNVKLLNNAIKQIKQDLDIYTVLDRLKELEKLKQLFLNRQQLILFNFFPKPVIKVNEELALPSRSLLHEKEQNKNKEVNQSIKESKFKRIYQRKQIPITALKAAKKFLELLKKKKILQYDNINAFYQLYEAYEIICGQQSTDINNKLIELLGEEMKSIFEKSKQMKFKVSAQKSPQLNFNSNFSRTTTQRVQTITLDK